VAPFCLGFFLWRDLADDGDDDDGDDDYDDDDDDFSFIVPYS